jgi:hypothetical protein
MRPRRPPQGVSFGRRPPPGSDQSFLGAVTVVTFASGTLGA